MNALPAAAAALPAHAGRAGHPAEPKEGSHRGRQPQGRGVARGRLGQDRVQSGQRQPAAAAAYPRTRAARRRRARLPAQPDGTPAPQRAHRTDHHGGARPGRSLLRGAGRGRHPDGVPIRPHGAARPHRRLVRTGDHRMQRSPPASRRRADPQPGTARREGPAGARRPRPARPAGRGRLPGAVRPHRRRRRRGRPYGGAAPGHAGAPPDRLHRREHRPRPPRDRSAAARLARGTGRDRPGRVPLPGGGHRRTRPAGRPGGHGPAAVRAAAPRPPGARRRPRPQRPDGARRHARPGPARAARARGRRRGRLRRHGGRPVRHGLADHHRTRHLGDRPARGHATAGAHHLGRSLAATRPGADHTGPHPRRTGVDNRQAGGGSAPSRHRAARERGKRRAHGPRRRGAAGSTGAVGAGGLRRRWTEPVRARRSGRTAAR